MKLNDSISFGTAQTFAQSKIFFPNEEKRYYIVRDGDILIARYPAPTLEAVIDKFKRDYNVTVEFEEISNDPYGPVTVASLKENNIIQDTMEIYDDCDRNEIIEQMLYRYAYIYVIED